jgi:ATP-dependent Clp protease adaptor protein ClpS
VAVRLDADALGVLDEARALARRYQHDAVHLEHLLTAMLEQARLSISGISRPELLARLEARLAARPRGALYRDRINAEPVLGADTETALRRADADRGLVLFRAVTLHELFVAVLRDPTLAALVVASEIESEELDDLLEQAQRLAISRQHELVTVDHVLRVMLDTTWFTSALIAVDCDGVLLRQMVEERLDEEPLAVRPSRGQPSLGLVDAVRFAKATASTSGADVVGVRHLLVNLLKGRHRALAFVEAEVPLLPLLRYVVAGRTDAGDDAPDSEGDLDVVFHNDDSTTMEFVVQVLAKCFDVTEPRAMGLMLDVHRKGERTIGTFTAEDARERVADARVMAEHASMPLRISLRARS